MGSSLLGTIKSWVHKVDTSAGPSYVGRPTAAAWPTGGTATRAGGSFSQGHLRHAECSMPWRPGRAMSRTYGLPLVVSGNSSSSSSGGGGGGGGDGGGDQAGVQPVADANFTAAAV